MKNIGKMSSEALREQQSTPRNDSALGSGDRVVPGKQPMSSEVNKPTIQPHTLEWGEREGGP